MHLLFVRSDLSTIVHHHPPIAADGRIVDEVTFPAPGRYRAVVDAHPSIPGAQKNFELFRWIAVAWAAPQRPLPAFTHVCASGATGCTSTLGSAQVTGTSATPGQLKVGVLVPIPGTWRLFVQLKVRGRVLTAPFTLKVS